MVIHYTPYYVCTDLPSIPGNQSGEAVRVASAVGYHVATGRRWNHCYTPVHRHKRLVRSESEMESRDPFSNVKVVGVLASSEGFGKGSIP